MLILSGMRGKPDRQVEKRLAVIGFPRRKSDRDQNVVLASLEQRRKHSSCHVKMAFFLVFSEISQSTCRVIWLFLL